MRQLLMTTLLCLTAILTASAQQPWWGLWNTGMTTTPVAAMDEGTNDQYIRMTTHNAAPAVGGVLHAMRFSLWDKEVVTGARVWLATGYPLTAKNTLYQQDVGRADLRDILHDGQPTVVTFSEPQTALPTGNPYATLLAGVTLQVSRAAATYVLTGAERSMAFSNYLNGRDMSTYGPLALQLQVSGPAIASESLTLQTAAEQTVQCSQDTTVSVPIVNWGSTPLQTVRYQVSIGGHPQPERQYTLAGPVDEIGRTIMVPVDYTVPATAGQHELTLSVVTADEPLTVPLVTLARRTMKRTVMEEFTGTWCHNCIRGMEGISKLTETYGGQFIPMAIHGDERDPMMVADYYRSQFFATKMGVLGGYPSCTIDRRYDCDPYCGWNTSGEYQTGDIVAQALRQTAVADLDVTAAWTDAEHRAVSCEVATRFAYNAADAHYRLILALTADGLKGDTNRWWQRNGYNDYTGTDEALQKYAGQGDYLKQMEYNHVLIAVDGVNGGIEGSITAPLSAEQAQVYSRTISTEGNALMQDPTRLSVVALLVDTRDGTVNTAATAPVSTFAAITTITHTAATDSRIYNLNGQPVTHPVRGLYISGGRKIVCR